MEIIVYKPTFMEANFHKGKATAKPASTHIPAIARKVKKPKKIDP